MIGSRAGAADLDRTGQARSNRFENSLSQIDRFIGFDDRTFWRLNDDWQSALAITLREIDQRDRLYLHAVFLFGLIIAKQQIELIALEYLRFVAFPSTFGKEFFQVVIGDRRRRDRYATMRHARLNERHEHDRVCPVGTQ